MRHLALKLVHRLSCNHLFQQQLKPVIASAPRPVTTTLGGDVPSSAKPDLSTVETSANVKPANAGYTALAMQPSSEIFTPAPTMTAGDKFAAVMKGAAIGGSTGLVHGLTKGVSMSIGSAGNGTSSLSNLFDVHKMVHNVEVPIHAEVEKFFGQAKRMMRLDDK
jgi:hypothetical protein